MGNAAIYYYPASGLSLTKIDLGEGLSHIEDYPVRLESSATGYDGAISRVIYTAWQRVNFSLELIDDVSLVSKLETFAHYASTGAPFSIVEDTDGVFGGYSLYDVEQGETSLEIDENQWAAWETPATGAGDYVIVQGPSPEYKRQVLPVSSRSGNVITLSSGSELDLTTQHFLYIRDRRFWPILRIQPGTENNPILRPNQRRLTWNLSMQAFEPADAFDALSQVPSSYGFPGINDFQDNIHDLIQQVQDQATGGYQPGDFRVPNGWGF